MPSVKIDTSESSALTPGIHLARIEHAVDAVSKAGNEMLKVEVKIKTVTLNAYVVFTTKNSVNVADFGRALGKQVAEGRTLTIEADDCIGKVVKVELGDSDRISDKTGKPYLEIKRWHPANHGADELESDEIPF